MTETMEKPEAAAQVPAVRNGVGKNAPVALPEWDLTLPAAVSMLQKSGFFGKSMTYEQAVTKAMIGRSMGMEPVEALRMIDVFDGNISIRSEYRAKRIKKADCNYKVTEHTDKLCSITFYNEEGGEEGSHTFTMEDAQKMELTGKANWKKSPKVMLFWRCLSQGQRMYLPHVLEPGTYDEDEMDDIKMMKRLESRADAKDAAKALTENIMGAALAGDIDGEEVIPPPPPPTVTTDDGTTVDTATGEVLEQPPATEPGEVPEDITDPFKLQ